jgi:hypothetical protein
MTGRWFMQEHVRGGQEGAATHCSGPSIRWQCSAWCAARCDVQGPRLPVRRDCLNGWMRPHASPSGKLGLSALCCCCCWRPPVCHAHSLVFLSWRGDSLGCMHSVLVRRTPSLSAKRALPCAEARGEAALAHGWGTLTTPSYPHTMSPASSQGAPPAPWRLCVLPLVGSGPASGRAHTGGAC